MKTKIVTGADLEVIYDALLHLADGEGCTVHEALTMQSDVEIAARIYEEVFAVD